MENEQLIKEVKQILKFKDEKKKIDVKWFSNIYYLATGAKFNGAGCGSCGKNAIKKLEAWYTGQILKKDSEVKDIKEETTNDISDKKEDNIEENKTTEKTKPRVQKRSIKRK